MYQDYNIARCEVTETFLDLTISSAMCASRHHIEPIHQISVDHPTSDELNSHAILTHQ